jgi:hypothetical protein
VEARPPPDSRSPYYRAVDVVEFRVQAADDAADIQDEPAVGLYVNGKALREYVDQAEGRYVRSARGDGYPGAYAALGVSDLADDWSRFLGGRAILLGCTCGTPECYPLTATVKADDDIVTWCDFESAHRGWSLCLARPVRLRPHALRALPRRGPAAS